MSNIEDYQLSNHYKWEIIDIRYTS